MKAGSRFWGGLRIWKRGTIGSFFYAEKTIIRAGSNVVDYPGEATYSQFRVGRAARGNTCKSRRGSGRKFFPFSLLAKRNEQETRQEDERGPSDWCADRLEM